MVFYIVLAVVVIMGIFIGFYHSFSRQLAFSSFHHTNRERLRNLTDIIFDSAFSHIQISTRDSSHEITKHLISQMRTPGLEKNFFPVSAPMFEEYRSELLKGGYFDYTIGARVFDKRLKNPNGYKYHEGEGLGTLELELDAALKNSAGKVLISCKRRRQYDMKAVCLVSASSERKSSYAMSFPLDFALIVRDGLREFSEGTPGESLNSGRKLVIKDQSSITDSKRGLIYFGNADNNSPDQKIYLNTTADQTDLLPTISANRFEIDQNECIRLVPEADTGGTYEGLKGIFTTRILPAALNGTPANDCETLTRHHLEIVPNNKRLVSAPAGLFIEGSLEQNYMKTIARGAITQRFLYLSEFSFDTSDMRTYTGDPIPEEGKQKIRNSIRGFIALDTDCTYLNDSSIPDSLVKRNRKIHAAKVKSIMDRLHPPMPLLSELSDDFLYYAGQNYQKPSPDETFPAPPPFYSRKGSLLSSINQTGGEGFRPYRHCTLYSTRFLYAKDLEDAGVYDRENGILNLRGIISVELEPVILSAPSGKQIVIKGQGALLAPQGFTIQAGMTREKPSQDLCVLFTRRGNINIATSDSIQASLLAFNDSNNASIVPNKNYNITGAVGVDRLYLSRYPVSESQITYDPRLKVQSKNQEIFAITISPWIRYENINFSKN